jgi:hypothetical protein
VEEILYEGQASRDCIVAKLCHCSYLVLEGANATRCERHSLEMHEGRHVYVGWAWRYNAWQICLLLSLSLMWNFLGEDEKVTLEQFSRILDWFGPMTGIDILDRVENLLKQRYGKNKNKSKRECDGPSNSVA